MFAMSRHETDQRFYARRAAEEAARAERSVTPSARNWHEKLARDFALRAQGLSTASEPRVDLVNRQGRKRSRPAAVVSAAQSAESRR